MYFSPVASRSFLHCNDMDSHRHFLFFFFILPPGSVMKTFSMLWLSCYSSPLWFKHQVKTEPVLNSVLILPSLCHLDTDSSAFGHLPSVWPQTHSLAFSEFLHWKWFSGGTKATVLYRAAGVCPVTDFVPVTQHRAWGSKTSPHFTRVYAEVTLRTRTFRTHFSWPVTFTPGFRHFGWEVLVCPSWYLSLVLVFEASAGLGSPEVGAGKQVREGMVLMQRFEDLQNLVCKNLPPKGYLLSLRA